VLITAIRALFTLTLSVSLSLASSISLSLAADPSVSTNTENKNSRDNEGLTELHRAAARGDLELVRKLLDQGADLWALDSRMGVSVLHKAVYSGNPLVVDYLLERGALVNLQSPSNGDTPLHDAIYFQPGNDERIIDSMLKHGASLAIKNRAGFTPIESARLLHKDSVANLLEKTAVERQSDQSRQLMQAVRSNDEDAVRKLLSQIRSATVLAQADEDGFTPLLWASREGYAGIVNMLLQHGADPNQNDQWMQANSGHKAAFWGRADVMKILCQNGLDINARGGYNGYTPLHDAVQGNHLDVVKVLLEHGARMDIKGHDGKTPVDIARANGDAKILSLLQSSPAQKP
jgi:ankyrin repeat protein